MKILIGVCSCHKNLVKRNACRDSWLKDLPENVSYTFFVGEGETQEPDVICLTVKDDYINLPYKVQAFCQYILKNKEFDYFFKCDDDTIVHTTRLLKLLDFNADLVGNDRFWGYDTAKDTMDGGAGYMLSKKAIEIIANTEHRKFDHSCEDGWISQLLWKSNVVIKTCFDLKPLYFYEDRKTAITVHKIRPDHMKTIFGFLR